MGMRCTRINLDPQGETTNADWWVIAKTPFKSPANYYYYNASGDTWQRGIKPRRLTENRNLLRKSINQPFFTLNFVK